MIVQHRKEELSLKELVSSSSLSYEDSNGEVWRVRGKNRKARIRIKDERDQGTVENKSEQE